MKRFLQQTLLGLFLGTVIPVLALGQTLLPLAKQQFTTDLGVPVTQGKVYMYVPGGTVKKTTWSDAAGTVPQTNPILLDAAGRPQPGGQIYGTGSYRQVVVDQDNVTIWDAVTSSTGGGDTPSGPTIGDSNAVGTMIAWAGYNVPSNYLEMDGRAISRTTYATLYGIATKVQTATCVVGNPTLTSVADTSKLRVGSALEATCIPPGTTIISKTSNTITMSNPATASQSTPVTAFPWGNGDGALTFNIPDFRGRAMVGENNMGGLPGSVLNTTYYGADPNALGVPGGAQSLSLITANMPPYTPAGSITNGAITSSPNVGGNTNVIGSLTNGPTTATGPQTAALASGNLSIVSTQAASTFTGSPQGGTSQQFTLVQPSITVLYLIKAVPNSSTTVAQIGQLAPGVPNQLAGTDNTGVWGNVTVPPGLAVVNSALNFDIPSLTQKVAPNAVNDYVIIYDAAGNATKKATVGSVGSAGASGVTSIGGVTGGILLGQGTAITGSTLSTSGGVPANVLRSVAANDTILNTDCGKTVNFTGGPFTSTLPSVAGFNAQCVVQVCNNNQNIGGQHAQRMSGYPAPLMVRLYPQQCVEVSIENATWTATKVPGRFIPNYVPQLFIDTGGSDTNDGIGSNAAANALRNADTCRIILRDEYDLRSTQPICSPTGGQTFVGGVSYVGGMQTTAVVNWAGNGGQAIIRAAAGSGTSALFLGDFAPYVISTNIRWDCAGAASNCAAIDMHQQTGLDFNSGTEVLGNSVTHVGIRCDSMCKVNGGTTILLTGTFIDGIQATQGSMFNLSGGISLSNSSSIQRSVVRLEGLSHLIMSGTITAGAGVSVSGSDFLQLRSGAQACVSISSVTGTWTGIRQYSVFNNATFTNLSANALPGSAGITTLTNTIPGLVANSGVSGGSC